MTIKKKKIISLFISFIVLIFISWVVFELAIPDVKGKRNPVKQFYYHITDVFPVKSAIQLAVPYHTQEHALSCEVASLLMALRYRGLNVTEGQLIQQLPISDPDPRHPDNTWDDPNLGFVGNINGVVPNTGYGVYEQPIYDLAVKYRNARIMTDGTLNDLIQELINNNPVVVWGVSGSGRNIFWKTPEGKIINAKLDEHVRTLIGYTGDSNNPQLIILLDPIYGKIRLSVKAFLTNWTILDKRAVVIY